MKILFVTATRIGDAVLSTGLLAYLIGRYPGASITVAAGPLAAPLFEAVPGLKRIIVVDKKKFALHWAKIYLAVAAARWDLVIDLRGSAIAYLLWAGERRTAAKGNSEEHRVRQLARLFDLDPPPAPQLWLAPKHIAVAAILMPPEKPFLAIGPAANWRGKEWRAERFAELAKRLTSAQGPLPGARVAIMAALHERAQAPPVIDALAPGLTVDLGGRADLGIVRAEPGFGIRALGPARRSRRHSDALSAIVPAGLEPLHHRQHDGFAFGRGGRAGRAPALGAGRGGEGLRWRGSSSPMTA